MNLIWRDKSAPDDPFLGRMLVPTTSAYLKGPCGDEMEFYLKIGAGRIEDVTYYTTGCEHTRMCGTAVSQRAKGKTVLEALGISPREIIEAQECLPEEGKHCAILAVSTLYRALANYLLSDESWSAQQ